jgi:hypothetical protein
MKVGDRVRVKSSGFIFGGQAGTVIRVLPDTIPHDVRVQVDEPSLLFGDKCNYDRSELEPE